MSLKGIPIRRKSLIIGKNLSTINCDELPHDIDGEGYDSIGGLQNANTLRTSAASANDKVTAKRLHQLLVEQRFKCKYTGIKLTPETASLDHVVPVSEEFNGHTMDNVVWVHTCVNIMKGTLSLEEFIQWCKQITEHSGKS